MDTPYRFFASIVDEVSIPKESIISRTLHSDVSGKVILFGFDAGQELSQHTASVPATVHILKGEGLLTLGEESYEVTAGSYAIMPANLSHSILAKTPLVMLLIMLQK